MPKITVDKEACIGCGACVATAGDLLEMGSDGKAKPTGKFDKKKAEEAEEVCPVDAIKVK